MNRVIIFAFRINQYERRMIAALANHLQRSKSDVLRFLVNAAYQELDLQSVNSERKEQDVALCPDAAIQEFPDAMQ